MGHSVDGVLIVCDCTRGDATLNMMSVCDATRAAEGGTTYRGDAVPVPLAIGALGTKTGAAKLAESVEGVLARGGGTSARAGAGLLQKMINPSSSLRVGYDEGTHGSGASCPC